MKLGTDMAVPDEYLSAVLSLYRDGLKESGLESVIFGHIGNNHLHVNILPHSRSEYDKGKELYLSWAEKVVGMNGTVSAEHGIGRAKKEFLIAMYGKRGIEQMEKVIRVFNPQRIISPGTMIGQED
jgi:D-lactate dehydrogenase (cytochrome)